MHWLVTMAQQARWLGVESLGLPAERPTAEVWPLVARALGLSDDELAQRVAARLRMPVADTVGSGSYPLRLVPAEVAHRYRVVPLRETDHELFVATYEPLNAEADQALGFVSGRRAVLEVASPARVDELLERCYGTQGTTIEGLLERVNAELADAVTLVEESGPELVSAEEVQDAPVIRLTNYIIHTAITQRASDVHIAPAGESASVRLRVDGVLRHYMHLPLAAHTRVISRIKVLGKMNIADRVRPQDGRARVNVGGRMYDLRISVVPTRESEKAVIRILDPSATRALEEIEMPELELGKLRQLLNQREGILFVTGPTGSGKTTTLYAALRELAARDINITTVEDPVEYELPGVTQIQIETKRGVTFASALRAILRQDPDVILVGEIRDLETAQIAVQAAMTGHLVLATLHTNDALGVVPRLVDLGLDRPSIAATVRGVVAQRLVRRVCPHCSVRVEGALNAEEERLAAQLGVRPVVRAVGCDQCGQTGYRGRVPEIELLAITPALAELITSGASAGVLQKAALAAGMRTLREVALERVRAGTTTIQEVERVLGETVEEGSSAAAEPAPDRPRVLVVEDDPVQARLARAVLEQNGYEAGEAADGELAWAELVGRGDCALVLTDLRMPNLDGRGLLGRIRGHATTATLPVVVLTGSAEEPLEAELLNEGADDYIRKPLEPARFAARIAAVLRRAGTRPPAVPVPPTPLPPEVAP